MATTYNDNGGAVNGSNLEYTFSFAYLKTEDVKVALNGTTQATTKYTVSTSPTKITFNNTNVDSNVQESTGAPKSGVTVRVYRDTDVDAAKAVYASGSSIRAVDLNNNQDQVLYALQEEQTQRGLAVTTTVQGEMSAADKAKLDGIETAATADQTAAEIRTLVGSATDSNVFTDTLKTKLDGIAVGAEVNVQSDWNSSSGDNQILNKPTIPTVDATSVNSAGAVMNSDLDGKGEILIGDGSGDPSALAVGTDAFVLTADSTEATGVKWAAAPGAGGGGSNITVIDESTTLSTAATKFTFTGDGVTATEPSSDEITVTIPGGASEGTDIKSTGESGGTKFLREDGDGTSSWQTVSTTDATKMPLAGGTFTGDVVFDNADNAGKDLTWDMSDDALEFSDDVKATFGGDNGLTIWHSTAVTNNHRTYLTNTKNDLEIQCLGTDADDVIMRAQNDFWVFNDGTNHTDGEAAIFCDGGAGVEIYYAGTKKFETTNTGVTVAGTVAATAFTGDGSALTGVTSTTINTNADNRVITGSGTANTLNGETKLTFDGTVLAIDGSQAGACIRSPIYENPKELAENHTIGANYNGMAAGPFSVAAGKSLTIESGATFTVV